MMLNLQRWYLIFNSLKFYVSSSQIHSRRRISQFFRRIKQYGFSSKSQLVRTAIEKLRQELKTEELRLSTQLYAEIYAEDKKLQELTELGTMDY